jgi:hypothetical protein
LLYSNNASNITITGLTLNGGGWNMDGNTSNVTFTQNTVQNILNSVDTGDLPVASGLYTVGYLNGASINGNTFYNMFVSGNYSFQYDVHRTAIWLGPSLNQVHINNNTFDHVYEGIHVCYEYYCPLVGGPSYDNNQFNNNTLTNNQRWPLEFQYNHLTNTQIKNNHISNALNGLYGCISYAASGTGDVISGNVCDASTPWPANPNIYYGICIEMAGGTATADSNVCRTNGLMGGGATYTQWGVGVAIGGWASPTISNNVFCGPAYPSGGQSGSPSYAQWEPNWFGDPTPDRYQVNTKFVNNSTLGTCPP